MNIFSIICLMFLSFVAGVLVNPASNWFDRQIVQEILMDYQKNLYQERVKAYNECFDNFYDSLSKSNLVLQKTAWIQGSNLTVDFGKAFIMVKGGSGIVAKGPNFTLKGGNIRVYGNGNGCVFRQNNGKKEE